MKSKRVMLEGAKYSDSFVKVTIDPHSGGVWLKLADCDRRIEWYFEQPGSKRGVAKITVVKKFIDELYAHIAKTEDKR